MKRLSKIWAHKKRIMDNQTLMNAEREIAEFDTFKDYTRLGGQAP